MSAQIFLSDEHYQYLQRRARSEGVTLDTLLSAIIEAEIAWQQTLAADPLRALIGQISDAFNTDRTYAVEGKSNRQGAKNAKKIYRNL